MRASLLFYFVAGITLAGHAQLEAPILPMRDWTSTDGRKIRAELMAFEGDGIRVRMEGGQRALVLIEKLSAADRAELTRLRFEKHYWAEAGEAANTRFYYSRLTPAGKTHEGIVALISIGPGRILFELKVHSATVDLRNYSRLRLRVPNIDLPHGYGKEQVASWSGPAGDVTRVVIQITPDDQAGILPVLKAGLAEGGSLSLAAVSDTAGTVEMAMSEEERKALSDLLSIFLTVQPLVKDGTIRKEPLEGQQFVAVAQAPAAAPSMRKDPAPGEEFDLLPEEAEALARFRTNRGGGRFGEIRWTPVQGETRSVGGLGWMRNRIVVRLPDEELRIVPFSEIEAEFRANALEQRLRDFSGPRPTESSEGSLYFPEGWSEHKRENSQGLIFGKRKQSGDPFLQIQAVANRFAGKRITEIAIRGDGGSGFVAVPIDAAANRVVQADGGTWSIATMPVGTAIARQMATLGGSRALDIRISSGDDTMTFPLKDDHLRVSLEALRCYEWAILIGPKR